MLTREKFKEAFETRDITTFMEIIFPEEWGAITARITETGATMSPDMVGWQPKVSLIAPTVRLGKNDLETHVKSCLFRAHDCIHQMWGLPLPTKSFSHEDFMDYKRAQMCGEVAVLTLTEFALAPSFRERFTGVPDDHVILSDLITSRNADGMLRGPLRGKTMAQIAARLDGLLHKKVRPSWVRSHGPSMAFCDDYVPMLEHDRRIIDHNWELMKLANFRAEDAPNVRYSPDLDGLELTSWMVTDFFHQMNTGTDIDLGLTKFNVERRSKVCFPELWNDAE